MTMKSDSFAVVTYFRQQNFIDFVGTVLIKTNSLCAPLYNISNINNNNDGNNSNNNKNNNYNNNNNNNIRNNDNNNNNSNNRNNNNNNYMENKTS